ncbi:SRPBCC family protein [Ekhidna sp.]|uniref:SRPBCC family protein n=1 Tax=Ekhidna sp. TaxID=2608089 RepID=UPI003B50EAA5
MKFEGHIDINKPIDMVAKYFADPKYLGEYQEGFEKKVLEEGEKGQDGAVSKMYYKNEKYEMVLTETIISNKLPNSFEAFYHHKHMDNTMKCEFRALSENETRYQVFVEYTRIDWFMPKLISILFPGMYKKPARKWMENFKRFVESRSS